MRRFYVISSYKDKDGDGEVTRSEPYIDVAEQDVVELKPDDKEVKMIEFAHKVFFDQIKFFTYIVI
jgi:hypothetical protein